MSTILADLVLATTGYATPDWVREVGDVGIVCTMILAAVGVVTVIYRLSLSATHKKDEKFVKRVVEIVDPLLDEKFERYTKPIQPESNGGKSLPDVHKKLNFLLEAMGYDLSDVPGSALAFDANVKALEGIPDAST
jgi:hypothetical protein